MFKAKRNRPEQVPNFATVDDNVKTQVGSECDPLVLGPLEKEVETGPGEPVSVTKYHGSMTKIEEMEFKSKHDKYLNWVHKVEIQLKKVYPEYYW